MLSCPEVMDGVQKCRCALEFVATARVAKAKAAIRAGYNYAPVRWYGMCFS